MRKIFFLLSILFSFSLVPSVNAMQGKAFSVAEGMHEILEDQRRFSVYAVSERKKGHRNEAILSSLSTEFIAAIVFLNPSLLLSPSGMIVQEDTEGLLSSFNSLVKDEVCLKKLAYFPWKLDEHVAFFLTSCIKPKLLQRIWKYESKKKSAKAKCSYGLLQALDNKFSDALALLTKAAEEGNANAIDNICIIGSRFFEKGEIASAKEWWLVADRFEYPEARIKLGVIDEKFKEVSEDPDNREPAVLSYIKGIGVQFQMKGDRGEAERWFEVLRLAMIKKKSGS